MPCLFHEIEKKDVCKRNIEMIEIVNIKHFTYFHIVKCLICLSTKFSSREYIPLCWLQGIKHIYTCLNTCAFVSYKRKSEAQAHQYRSLSVTEAECRLSLLSLSHSLSLSLSQSPSLTLLWHKPIKPRLIGHVKWRNRARTQVWHFIIISTAFGSQSTTTMMTTIPLPISRSINLAPSRCACVCVLWRCCEIFKKYSIFSFDVLISCDKPLWGASYSKSGDNYVVKRLWEG